MTESTEQVILAWPSRVKLLNNPVIWSMMLRGLPAIAAISGLLVGFAARNARFGLVVAAGGFVFLLVVFLGTGVLVDLFGGFRVTFALTSEGVRSVRGKGGNAASRAAIIGGALAGSMTAVGAGLLAESERNVFIAYPDVRKVKISAGGRYVLVKAGFGEKPIGLYCPAELAPRVAELLRERCPAAAFS